MATIITKNSSTASSVPTAAQLLQGELAVNVTDRRLFTENSSGSVVELGTNPSSLTLPNGTANGVAYLNGSKVLTTGSALTFDGTNLSVGTTSFVSRFNVEGNVSLLGGNKLYLWNTANSAAPYIKNVGSSDLGFFDTSDGERMRLTSTGLGIGTSSPGYPLEVRKDQNAGTKLGVQNQNSGASALAGIDFQAYGGGWQIEVPASTTFVNPLRFSFNGTERMRLDSSGNLGLGVTPSAWGSYKAFQNGGTSVADFGGANNAIFGSNMYFDGSAFRYIGTSFASSYRQVSGQHQWYTAPSGTAGNTISFTQAMTLHASGGLSVGSTTDPGAGNVSVGSNKFFGFDTNAKYVPDDASVGGALYTGGGFRFFTGGANERARIDSSGNLLVGTTSQYASAARLNVAPTAANGPAATFLSANGVFGTTFSNTSGTSGYYPLVFFNDGFANTVGSIFVAGSSTAYNTSSDYRLKENIQPMTGALAKVAALKPCTYKWKADGSDGEGFIAHELAEVVPQCVTGEKDAVDAEGKPVYQGIDTSFLVATLTAAIQELKAEFDAYKATHP